MYSSIQTENIELANVYIPPISSMYVLSFLFETHTILNADSAGSAESASEPN